MFFSPSDWQSLIFRLMMALMVGGIIGLNRQRSGRAAGLRTFMVVSLGAALFVMIPLQAERDLGYASSNALSRTIQGVASGIGFLGAGIILQQSHQEQNKIEVKGLTSAAAIWLSAALGAAAGCGLWRMTLVGIVLTLIVLSGVKKLKKKNFSSLKSITSVNETNPNNCDNYGRNQESQNENPFQT